MIRKPAPRALKGRSHIAWGFNPRYGLFKSARPEGAQSKSLGFQPQAQGRLAMTAGKGAPRQCSHRRRDQKGK
ncbi:MAG: hypothetical protein GY820_22760 [Gammaproteobacteria bacterium]|nr:hypothetical protein [Gammaproteobacteria bacterium]